MKKSIERTAARGRSRSGFLRDARGVAAVELALLLPVAFLMLGLAVFGGEGLGIQRKVTLAARTVTDLVGQTSTSGAVNSTAVATLNQSTLDYYLSLSSLIVYPYDSSQLQATVSEVLITTGSTTATVVWSEGYNGATARPTGQAVTISSNIANSVTSSTTPTAYMLLGETQYGFSPPGLAGLLGAMTISGQIFMIPRSATQINVVWGS